MFSCWGFQRASDVKHIWRRFKGLIQSPVKAMERLHWFRWAWGQTQLLNHDPILPSPKIQSWSLQIKINNRIIQNFVYRIQKVTVDFLYKIQLFDSIFISHMYKYNPNNMIFIIPTKILLLFGWYFFLQKFTKQIILYIYNPILWRVPSPWWKIDYKGSALSHGKEREKRH